MNPDPKVRRFVEEYIKRGTRGGGSLMLKIYRHRIRSFAGREE